MATTIQPLNYNIHIRRITSKRRAFKCYVTHLLVPWQPNRPHPVPRRHLAWTVRRCNGSWTPESPFFGYPRNPSRMDRWSSSPSSLVLKKISGILSGTLCCKIGPKCKLTVSQWTWRNRLCGTSPSLRAFFGDEKTWVRGVEISWLELLLSSKISRSPRRVINIEPEVRHKTHAQKSIKFGQSPYKQRLISLLSIISLISRSTVSDCSQNTTRFSFIFTTSVDITVSFSYAVLGIYIYTVS